LLSFRETTKNDIDFLTSLRRKTMEEHLVNNGSIYNDEEQKKRVLLHYEKAEIVIYKNEEIGLIKIDKTASPWIIIQVQILPFYQNNGLGNQILQLVINNANQCSEDIELNVLKSNPAIRLYKRLGFQIVKDKGRAYTMKYSENWN
jgi:ribosomal protein S18 acetylase RimI-like enzyme